MMWSFPLRYHDCRNVYKMASLLSGTVLWLVGGDKVGAIVSLVCHYVWI